MHRLLPEVGQSSRGHGWWFVLTVTGIARFLTACREEKCKLRLRCAFRCRHPAVQAGLWRDEARGEQWSAGSNYMVRARAPDASGSSGWVYMVIDFSTAVRYIGSTYPLFIRRLATVAHLRCFLSAKLHLSLCGFVDDQWSEYWEKGVRTAMEPLRMGWPASWVSSIGGGTQFVQTRTCSRLNMFFGLWLLHDRCLVGIARAQQNTLGPEFGFAALSESRADSIVDFVGPPPSSRSWAEPSPARKPRR